MVTSRRAEIIEGLDQILATLAVLWSSAWAEAGAAAPPARGADKRSLRRRYSNPDFAPSLYLTELANAMVW